MTSAQEMQPHNISIAIAIAILFTTQAEAKTTRSYAPKAEFKRLQPCPATGAKRGPCPGYQVDHITPLKCNGEDHHSNMQWLTVDDHKAKTAREAGWCRH